MSAHPPDILLTDLDLVRLESLLEDLRRRSPAERHSTQALELRVDSARVVQSRSIAPQVVTMNSVVAITDRQSRTTSEVTLVYPRDADVEGSRVSVLSPVGRALIGAHAGDVLHVRVPGERDREFAVNAILYQPEANGRYDL